MEPGIWGGLLHSARRQGLAPHCDTPRCWGMGSGCKATAQAVEMHAGLKHMLKDLNIRRLMILEFFLASHFDFYFH